MPAMPLDPAFARAQFPETCWNDGWAFFENAGGAYVPESVIARLTAYMTECQVQPQAPYPKSQIAAERMAAGHAAMAAMIGAGQDEVTVGPSTSLNVYVLANALRPLWRDGDEVVVATLNHEANSTPWRRLAESGIKVIEWPVHPDSGALAVELLPRLLTEKTRLVAFPHVSNITGDINDVAAITRDVHAAGAMVCVDGVAFAPHRTVDVKAWDVDFYLYSFYKVFGPHMGLLYARRDRALAARNQGHAFFAKDDLYHKLMPAGPMHEGIACLQGIADYFEALAAHHGVAGNSLQARVQGVFKLIAAHEEVLADGFLKFINSRDDIRLIGRKSSKAADRAPTFSFTVKGKKSAEVVKALLPAKVALWNGDFYAPRLLKAVGIADTEDGVIRASMAHYNTVEEVERLAGEIKKILSLYWHI